MSQITVEQFREMTKPRHKYHVANAADRTYGGRVFDSKREMIKAQELDLLKLAGDITEWWPQYRIPLVVNGSKVAEYIADFRVLYPDGHYELVEVKGCETAAWKLKYKLVRALYPRLILRVVK